MGTLLSLTRPDSLLVVEARRRCACMYSIHCLKKKPNNHAPDSKQHKIAQRTFCRSQQSRLLRGNQLSLYCISRLYDKTVEPGTLSLSSVVQCRNRRVENV